MKLNLNKQNWQTKKLGEVCEIKTGSTPLKSNRFFWENGTISWFTIEDIRKQGRKINFTNQKITELAAQKLTLYPPDTILLCCTASVGEYAITKIYTTSNQQFNGLVINNKKLLLPEFLFYFCSTLKEKLLLISGKTTIDFVSITKLKTLEISIPPLSEQQQIVTYIDSAFTKIDQLKNQAQENLIKTDQLWQSILSEELKMRLGWQIKELGEVCEILNGGTPKTNMKEYWNGDILWITPKDMGKIKDKFISNTERKITQQGLNKCSSNLLPINSVILSSRAPIGRLAINTKKMCTNQGCKGLIPEKRFNFEFLYYFLLNSVDLLNKLGSGTTFKEISTKKLSTIRMLIPPLSEQQQIVTKLDSIYSDCQKLKNNYQKIIDNCEELKKSILNDIFSLPESK